MTVLRGMAGRLVKQHGRGPIPPQQRQPAVVRCSLRPDTGQLEEHLVIGPDIRECCHHREVDHGKADRGQNGSFFAFAPRRYDASGTAFAQSTERVADLLTLALAEVEQLFVAVITRLDGLARLPGGPVNQP